MAAWWGDIDSLLVLDNATLLRAIDIFEDIRPRDILVNNKVVNQHYFAPIRDNDHLRKLLRAFLEADMAVRQHQLAWSERSRIYKLCHRKKVKAFEERLGLLKTIQKAKYDEYEMLRRLVCWDNKALERRMSD